MAGPAGVGATALVKKMSCNLEDLNYMYDVNRIYNLVPTCKQLIMPVWHHKVDATKIE